MSSVRAKDVIPGKRGGAMVESNNAETKITFKVQNPNNSLVTPVWRKVEVGNANYPVCKKVMAVVVGDNMYGYCPQCQCYYLADDGGKR